MKPFLEKRAIKKRFDVEGSIGKGGFGKVYKGTDKNLNIPVAIKVQPTSSTYSHLFVEHKVMHYLKGGDAYGGFPKSVYYRAYRQDEGLAMTLLGPDLRRLFKKCNNSFTIKTVLLLADQLIYRLQYLHRHGIIHRDIKPDNIVMGLGDMADTVFLIDFGLALKYKDTKFERGHIFRCRRKELIGTLAYMSINAHSQYQQSRRDDLESLAYVLLHFLTGELPWNSVGGSQYQKNEKIWAMKHNIPLEEMWAGFPIEFPLFLRMVRNLGYEEEPQYNLYRKMFAGLAYCLGIQYDNGFDWKGMAGVEEVEVENFEVEEDGLGIDNVEVDELGVGLENMELEEVGVGVGNVEVEEVAVKEKSQEPNN